MDLAKDIKRMVIGKLNIHKSKIRRRMRFQPYGAFLYASQSDKCRYLVMFFADSATATNFAFISSHFQFINNAMNRFVFIFICFIHLPGLNQQRNLRNKEALDIMFVQSLTDRQEAIAQYLHKRHTTSLNLKLYPHGCTT